MKFYTKKRKKPTVPIITLIDILAILLIFFIVTTTFKKKESLLKVNLPRSSEMAASATTETRIPLALSDTGEISLGAQSLTLEQVPGALQALKRSNPEAKLEMKADSETSLGLMVKLWDAATKAGVEINDIPLRIRLEQ
ncbi:MAG: biopolymer transporter ExbD [Verrucomicrobiales bacterium]|nr:biopolymer transporter ExbD [Verrucomicrobiales bacterium]